MGIIFIFLVQALARRFLIFLVKLNLEVEKLEKEEKDIEFFLEKHNNVLYCYESVTNTFVGQADTLQEVIQFCKDKYPGKSFKIKSDDIDMREIDA